LSEDLELHFLRAPRAALSALRARHTLRSIGSRRNRSEPERALLRERGTQTVVYELQGDLTFCGIERLARQIAAEADAVDQIVVDFSRITGLDGTAARFVLEQLKASSAAGRMLVFVALQRFTRLVRMLEEARALDPALEFRQFDELDLALEWCESRVLGEGGVVRSEQEVPLEEHELLRASRPRSWSACAVHWCAASSRRAR
jgi:glutaminase